MTLAPLHQSNTQPMRSPTSLVSAPVSPLRLRRSFLENGARHLHCLQGSEIRSARRCVMAYSANPDLKGSGITQQSQQAVMIHETPRRDGRGGQASISDHAAGIISH